MKYVFLAIFVLFAAQPVQSSTCNMHDARQTSHDGSHGMKHDRGHGMDCCDHQPSGPADHCDSLFHCGACPTGVLSFGSLTVSTILMSNARLLVPDSGRPLSNFNPPPYKPPIA